MPFAIEDRQALLGCKGVGPTVVARLEQMGYLSLAQLAKANAQDILQAGATLSGSTCWKNSPQAQAAVVAVLNLARSRHG